jgi:hypothetical protein
MTTPNMSGSERMARAVEDLELARKLADVGLESDALVVEVADSTFRTISDVAFGECDITIGLCKFYGADGLSVCDRSCNIPVWDQI